MRISQNWIALKTLVKKETTRFMRIWTQTILPPAITMTLYFIIFGQLIGSQVSNIDQYSFMQFMAPGLIMMSIITNAFTNVVSSFYMVRFQRSVEEMLVSPMSNFIILLGYVAGGIARGLLVGIVVLIIALFFTKLHMHSMMTTLIVAISSATLFSLAGFTNGLFAKKFDDIAIIPTFILTPLTYLGGVFYTLNQLPAFWKPIATINPILYIISAFRSGMLGMSDVSNSIGLSIILGLIIILFGVNLWLLNKGVGIRT